VTSSSEVATRITTAWAGWLETDRYAPVPHSAVYASAWRVCDRRMALELLFFEEVEEPE
jgi:hypothetical protein